MRSQLIGAAMAGTLLFTGASACAAETQNETIHLEYDPMAAVTSDEVGIITEAFTDVTAYWTSKGAGVAAVKLVLIEDAETAQCKDDTQGFDQKAYDSRIRFCYDSKTMLFSQAGINAMNYLGTKGGASKRNIWRVIIGHEYGHAMQGEKAPVDPTLNDNQIKAKELQADCYAGVYIANVDPSDPSASQDATDLYNSTGSKLDFRHGEPQERIASFAKGFSTANCDPV